ncbi:low molecular weight protein-tyrosine-phosphatase [Rhizobium sp. S96]|uniref:low molecular weight protein-tyrosine-phosphatase n=1 Tax=Rhizobium sp. S96 TaxID=3055140 RepID=UPI0025AAF3A3|nr:low molecular weight protein-tyrosine-phosphatase [Rhizobium sp. S96]MDM9621387.1 low molecular weight protein-tyrosine-phosphatase [Rhizobium sp. S96]
MKRISILFVCMGNICRSPLAEGIFTHLAAEAGLSERFAVDSAGTGGWHEGEPPDHRSIAIARKYGVDISAQRARRIRKADFSAFDMILAMDRDNVADLLRIAPSAGNIRLFGDAAGTGEDIPDSYYGDNSDFQLVYARLLTGCRKLLAAFGADNAS